MTPQATGIAAALGSGLAWAVGIVILKRVKADVPALGLTVVTGLCGALLLGGWLAVTRAYPFSMPLDVFLTLGLSGLLGIAIGDTLFFASLGGLGAHLVVLFGILGQALTVLLAVAFLGEKLNAVSAVGISLVVGGVCLAMYKPEPGEGKRSSSSGIVFGVLSAVVMAVSTVVAKSAMESVSAVQATFIRMLWGTAGVFALGLVSRRLSAWVAPVRDRRVFLKLLAAILVGTVGGFVLFHVAMKLIDVSIANPLSATEPLFAIPLSAWLLRERVTPRAAIGAVAVVSGAAVLCLG